MSSAFRFLLSSSVLVTALLTLCTGIEVPPPTKQCPRGSFLSPKTATCIPCPSGYYQNLPNASSCQPCPPGTFSQFSAVQTVKACRSCPRNTYSLQGANQCAPCQSGTVSLSRSASCARCPPGSILQGAPGNGQGKAALCEPVQFGYTDKFNMLSRMLCPPASLAPPGAQSIKQCKPCPSGKYVSFNGVSCEDYRIATIDGSVFSARQQCPRGTRPNPSNRSICLACNAKEYQVTLGDNRFSFQECRSCPEGTNTYSVGRTFCRRENSPCPKGYIQTSSGDCERCPVDFFYDTTVERCRICPQGQGSVGGLPSACSSCADVLLAGMSDSQCRFEFYDATSPDRGGNCSKGTRRSEKDNRICIQCSKGTFSNQTNADSCAPCPLDSIQSNSASSDCIPCPEGTVANNERTQCVTPETHCLPDRKLVTSKFAPDRCVYNKCPNQIPYSGDSSGSCGPCFYASFLNPKKVCQSCPLNSTSDGRVCTQCPAPLVRFGFGDRCVCGGPYGINIGIINGSCKTCPPGSHGGGLVSGPHGTTGNACIKCKAGTFRADVTRSDMECAFVGRCGGILQPCKPCPLNSTSEEGAMKCKPCPTGTFTYGIGDESCLKVGASSEPIELDEPVRQSLGAEPSSEPSAEPSAELELSAKDDSDAAGISL